MCSSPILSISFFVVFNSIPDNLLKLWYVLNSYLIYLLLSFIMNKILVKVCNSDDSVIQMLDIQIPTVLDNDVFTCGTQVL